MTTVLLSCEHATNTVPLEFAHLFGEAEDVLASHRGWDEGACDLARGVRDRMNAPLVEGEVSRLLIDLNRSLGHRRQWSSYSKALDGSARAHVVATYYAPYRQRFIDRIEAVSGRVVHLSIHTFTPVFDGATRAVDLGLLYDPARRGERALCDAWTRALRAELPAMRIRRNAPYRGNADGFTTALRRRYDDARYVGIEIELNQTLVRDDARVRDVADALAATLGRVMR